MGHSLQLCAKRCCAAAIVVMLAAASRAAQAQPAPVPTIVPQSLPALQAPPLPAGAPSLVPAGKPLSLKDAVALALVHQPQVMSADAATAAAAGRTQQATSALFPSLSISSQYQRSGAQAGTVSAGATGGTATVSGSSTSTSYTASLSAQQLLYDFGRTRSQLAQARNLQRATGETLAQTRQDVVNQVKQAYYSMLQDQRLVVVQERNVTDQQAHLAQAQAFYKAGKAPWADVVATETAVAQAVLNLATAQNAAAIARVNLNLAMGVDVRTPTQVEDTDEPAPSVPDPAALVEYALAHRADMQQVRFSVEATKNALRVAHTGNLPDVLAAADYGLRGSDFPPDRSNWTYAVSVQWPIFDSGLTRGRVKESEANLRLANANLRQAEQTVASDVAQAYLNVQTAEQQITVAGVEVANAEESLRVATGRYDAGVAIHIEVLDAQAALLTAQTNQVNARQSLSTARAALKRALGIEEGQ